MMLRARRIAFFAMLLALFAAIHTPQSAYACTCAPDLPEFRFSNADVVFRGQVVNIDYAPASPGVQGGAQAGTQTGLHLEVEDTFKGEMPDRAYFAYQQINGSCFGPPPFATEGEYLFYGYRASEGFQAIGGCARVVPMASAGGDYAYILGLNTSQWPDPIRDVAHNVIAVGVLVPWLWPALIMFGFSALYLRIRARRLTVLSLRS